MLEAILNPLIMGLLGAVLAGVGYFATSALKKVEGFFEARATEAQMDLVRSVVQSFLLYAEQTMTKNKKEAVLKKMEESEVIRRAGISREEFEVLLESELKKLGL